MTMGDKTDHNEEFNETLKESGLTDSKERVPEETMEEIKAVKEELNSRINNLNMNLNKLSMLMGLIDRYENLGACSVDVLHFEEEEQYRIAFTGYLSSLKGDAHHNLMEDAFSLNKDDATVGWDEASQSYKIQVSFMV